MNILLNLDDLWILNEPSCKTKTLKERGQCFPLLAYGIIDTDFMFFFRKFIIISASYYLCIKCRLLLIKMKIIFDIIIYI